MRRFVSNSIQSNIASVIQTNYMKYLPIICCVSMWSAFHQPYQVSIML